MVDWEGGNELHLRAAIERVRLFALAPDGHAPDAAALAAVEEKLAGAALALQPPPAVEQLAAAFELSPFERDVVLWCAGAELDGTLGAATGEPISSPSFARALAALPGADWRALTPSAPLRWFRLIEPQPGEPLAHGRLRVDEWVLHFLRGRDDGDERLSALIRPAGTDASLAPSQARVASEMARAWLDPERDEPVAFLLTGADSATRLTVAIRALELARIEPHLARAPQLVASGADLDLCGRLWQREVMLRRAGLVIEHDDGEPPDRAQAAASWIDALRGPLVVSARDFVRGASRALVRLDLGAPTREEQLVHWRQALGQLADELNGGLDTIVGQFNLDASSVTAAAEQVAASLAARPEAKPRELLWEHCRVRARGRLEDLAQRIESAAEWNDLVLPETELAILRSIASHVRGRAKVLETWGFAGKGPRGLGTTALFTGTSGTGKTLAAEVIANELKLDLYRIDLSQVVNKYIGETEKNLRRIFDAADEGGAILLFDEADALFGKRSEVSDSHDRYANIEVSYLLQRMEQYRGLAVLTTNMRHALDAAFLRRLRFVVEFPFPDLMHRSLIWQRVFPRELPVSGVDVLRLARLNLSGGHIRNVALGAAFMAAEQGSAVAMRHLREAARHEFKKMNQPLPERDVADW